MSESEVAIAEARAEAKAAENTYSEAIEEMKDANEAIVEARAELAAAEKTYEETIK